ncbi:uncharacterized protein G2W53_038516 [Senna tora]|uniref:ENT domain-containing protein n=1 Tax=Senna tora TaxID=362788 RepID=A0A834SP60_9FABA|nr:uncharacterized protein G2W53_038516 [Senna tora]
MPFVLLMNSTVMTDRYVFVCVCDRDLFRLKLGSNIIITMKFKKGTKVEVLSKTEVPSGSWRSAEIICGNGHHYTVRYDGYKDNSGDAIGEKVSRKAIRPCPPAVEVTKDWSPGDLVEVCQNSSWAMATILKVLGKKYILVRLLGSSSEFKVNKSDIRVRQSWQDDKWIVVGKGGSSCDNGKHDDPLAPRLNFICGAQVKKTTTKRKLSFDHDHLHDKKEVNLLNSRLVFSKTLKQGIYSQVKVYAEPPQKFRATENEGICHRARVANPPTSHKQVHGDVFPRDVQTEEYIENFESNDADSVTSSVGSCSITNSNLYKSRCPVYAGPPEEGALSDAESVCHCSDEERNDSLPSKEELAAEIHRLELHAYRSTIEALHASGPLSWELEALMTNLRRSLHISNDEHLMELRNLISSENSIPIR